MAGVQPRQLLAWSLPALALICSYFWLRRRRHFTGKPDKKDQSSSNGSVKSEHWEAEDIVKSGEGEPDYAEKYNFSNEKLNKNDIIQRVEENLLAGICNLTSQADLHQLQPSSGEQKRFDVSEKTCTSNHSRETENCISNSEVPVVQEELIKTDTYNLKSSLTPEVQVCNLVNFQAVNCREGAHVIDCSCTSASTDCQNCSEEDSSHTCCSVEDSQCRNSCTKLLESIDDYTESHLEESLDTKNTVEDSQSLERTRLRPCSPERTDCLTHSEESSVLEVSPELSATPSIKLETPETESESSCDTLLSPPVESQIICSELSSTTEVCPQVDCTTVLPDSSKNEVSLNQITSESSCESSITVQSQSSETLKAADVKDLISQISSPASDSVQLDDTRPNAAEKESSEDCLNCAQGLPGQTLQRHSGVGEEGHLCSDSDKGVGDCPNSSTQDHKMAWHCNAGPAGDSSVVQATQKQTDCPTSSAEDVNVTNGSTERDSANHSPADAMLGSPSVSNDSDNHSENSSDSGKGGSDVATSGGCIMHASVFEFLLPQHLVGRLIGRHGSSVQNIRSMTHASVVVKRHPDTPSLKIVAVEGTQEEIDAALELIRTKFPLKKFPEVTLEQVSFAPVVPSTPIVPDFLQLQLISGVNNDVILSSLVSAGHFFVQQPTHPTYPPLSALDRCMAMCYSEPTAPPLPLPVQVGVVCAAPALDGWYRAQVVSSEELTDDVEVRFVDYGGYLRLEASALRQIRSDFMLLPFQATECCLANVQPVGVEEGWSIEATACVEELTQGRVLQAQVVGYSSEGITFVLLYATQGPMTQPILVNQELVERGLATWIDQITPEQ